MRSKERIDVVLSKIREIWTRYPDLRLMQLLLNCFDMDAYYVEEPALLKSLEITYPRGEMDITRGFDPRIAGSSPAGGTSIPRDIDVIRDALLLVGYYVPTDIISTWTPEKRQHAEDWAMARHLSASDNENEVPQRPDWLDGYEEDDDLVFPD
jgi:hypothetical protein